MARFWGTSCKLVGASPSLSSLYQPPHDFSLCFSWSQTLPKIKYAHEPLNTILTGLPPFQCCIGYWSPLFQVLEEAVAVASAQAFIHRCQQTWTKAQTQLQWSVSIFKHYGKWHRSSSTSLSSRPESHAFYPSHPIWNHLLETIPKIYSSFHNH